MATLILLAHDRVWLCDADRQSPFECPLAQEGSLAHNIFSSIEVAYK
jgi:hypothetical protein